MSTLDLVLLLTALGAAAAAITLALSRTRLAAEHAAASAARDAAQAHSARLAAALDDARRTHDDLQRELAALRTQAAELRERADAERRINAEKLAATEQARQVIDAKLAEFDERCRHAFGALAGETLKATTGEFLKLATERLGGVVAQSQADLDKRRAAVDDLVRPIADTLRRTDEKLAAIERDRTAAYAGLVQEVKHAAATSAELRSETGKLVRALSRPEVRGRYGEWQLRRIAELAGMKSYCDFAEQVAQRDSEGRLLRPDMVVRLPNQRIVAVDAKMNVEAYMQAMEATGHEAQQECLERFAKHVSDQVDALSRKGYWKEFDGSPDFVVMFVPGDQLLDAALVRRPDLLDRAAERAVILASPATLIGLLRAVAVGWREERLADDAHALFELGKELHERAAVAIAHASKLGESLTSAVEKFNLFAGSLESRLLPTLRKFEDSGVSSGKTLPALPAIETRPRTIDPIDSPALPFEQSC